MRRPRTLFAMDEPPIPIAHHGARRATTREVHLREEPIAEVARLADVSIAFEVRSAFDVVRNGVRPADVELVERSVDPPYVKDYDSYDGEGPAAWSHAFDLTHWAWISAFLGESRVGGAVIAFNTPYVDLLEGRTDLAVLWDLRVAPSLRGHGVGARLFRAAEVWARARGCAQLKVETQNVNVPACRFYARMGCVLRGVDARAYPNLPDEIQLLWYRDLE